VRSDEEVGVLARFVGIAALLCAGLLVAYDLTSGASYSEGPMPSVRDALACDGPVYQARQTTSVDVAMKESTPRTALQAGLSGGEEWWISTDGFRLAFRKGDRQLFVYDADHRARFAALVERRGAPEGWQLSAWAMCDPSELTGNDADSLGYGVWLDAAGAPVPTSTVMSLHGPERCGTADVTFIELDRDSVRMWQFVHDPSGHLDQRLRTTYAAHARLPEDARDTGWRRPGRALWLQPRGAAAYLVNLADPADVQRWPRARKPITCT
jgi:hypothetical protein